MSRKKKDKFKWPTPEEREAALAGHQRFLEEVDEARNNPEKRIWPDSWKRLSRACTMGNSVGGETVQALNNLKNIYISKGWMNEEGEWIG
ncbi:hypothetical protein FACS1894110_00640 [Spirochaetia bacterium]|nr:hypothetical protein FACS1894110_00640 [Spirochaetia bacterium]